MHHVVRFVVEAESAEEARRKAEVELNGIAGEGRPYGIDYGTFFDEPSTASGAARWGKLPVASPLLSKVGLRILLDGFSADYEQMARGFEEVKKCMGKGLHFIYHDRMASYHFRMVDKCEFVWRVGWGFIRSSEMKDEKANLWVVPCDVHT